jgi:thiol:disulfide interchange protein DsbD
MNRRIVFAVLMLLVAGSAAAAPSADPWLQTSAYADHEAVPQGGSLRVAMVLQIAEGYHLNANPPTLEFQIPTVLTPEPAPGIRWGDVRYPPGKPFAAAWAEGAKPTVYEGRTVLVLEGTVAGDAPLGPTAVRLKLDYQGCDATTCFQPASREVETAVTVVGANEPPAAANAAVFGEIGGEGRPTPQAVRIEGQMDLAATFERSALLYLGALFVGGLLLNLTPCVFPLIPVTMTVFMQQGESRPLRVLPLAVLYVLGLAATFTLVGIVAAMAGKSLGLVLEQPIGVLGVVVILAAMMASLFGAFEIGLPSGLMGTLSARRGLFGAAFTGAVMGAVAAPCVGPFLVALITLVATKRSVPFGAVSFFVTGLGLGFPYLFLGMFTGLVNRFPRSGGWLVWTKRLMGLALAGLILYYIQQFVEKEFFRLLVLGLFLFAAAYLGFMEGLSRRPFTRRFQAVRIAAALVLVAAGTYVYGWTMAARPEIEWTDWTPGSLEAARADRQPALVYFGAEWCIECKQWDAAVFRDPAVIQAAGPLARLRVDVTRLEEGPKKEFAERSGGANPPLAILYGRDGTIRKAWRDPPGAGAFTKALTEAAAVRP